MGYSISEKTYQRQQRNRADGRECNMSTGRGGCYTRATYYVDKESWYYADDPDRKGLDRSEITMCSKHAHEMAYWIGKDMKTNTIVHGIRRIEQ